jgi:hypothetical protein
MSKTSLDRMYTLGKRANKNFPNNSFTLTYKSSGRIILKTSKHTHTHRCFDIGMPKNVNLSTHVWAQKSKNSVATLVGDKDIHRKHTQGHTKQSH